MGLNLKKVSRQILAECTASPHFTSYVSFRGETILTSSTVWGGRCFYYKGTFLPISLKDSYKLARMVNGAKKSELLSWIEKHDLG
jgi:hypothetical protein